MPQCHFGNNPWKYASSNWAEVVTSIVLPAWAGRALAAAAAGCARPRRRRRAPHSTGAGARPS